MAGMVVNSIKRKGNMKPRIYWNPAWRGWVCHRQSEEKYHIVGYGDTPLEAYNSWLRDEQTAIKLELLMT